MALFDDPSNLKRDNYNYNAPIYSYSAALSTSSPSIEALYSSNLSFITNKQLHKRRTLLRQHHDVPK